MAIGKLVKKVLGRDTGVEIKAYNCADCDETFDSAKQPERASCPECLSNDVSVAQTADSHT
ncbi:MAG: hypothetical protein ABEH59_00535 [Halobacteriales archaeon]